MLQRPQSFLRKIMYLVFGLVFLTAISLKEDIISELKIGAEDCITNPFDLEIL